MSRAVVRVMKRKRDLTKSARALCVICKRNVLPKDASADLCVRCRKVLACFDYDPANVERAIAYLEKHRGGE